MYSFVKQCLRYGLLLYHTLLQFNAVNAYNGITIQQQTDPTGKIKPNQHLSHPKRPVLPTSLQQAKSFELVAANFMCKKSVKQHLNSANKILKQSSYFANVKPLDLSTKFRNKHANFRQEFSAIFWVLYQTYNYANQIPS